MDEEKIKKSFQNVKKDIEEIKKRLDRVEGEIIIFLQAHKSQPVSASLTKSHPLVDRLMATKDQPIKLDLDKFSEKENEILNVFFKHKDMALSYLDVSKVLNKSPNTIKNQINAIRKKKDIFEVVISEKNKNRFRFRQEIKIERSIN